MLPGSLTQSLQHCSLLFKSTGFINNGTRSLANILSSFCFSSSSSSLLALNGGGRFLSPSSPLSSLLCSLVSWETLSALLSKLKYSGSPTVALARLLLESTPGVQCSETLLRSSPTLQTYRHSPPDHSPLFASIRWPGQAGLTSAGSVAAGSDGCLLGRIHFPCGYVVYVLLCCWGVFPVLTLYSPRSIVWGLFFSPPFPHVNAVFFFNSTCISLLIILVWLCM